MKYFISYTAIDNSNREFKGNAEFVLNFPINMEAIIEIQNQIKKSEDYEVVVINNFIKFEENI